MTREKEYNSRYLSIRFSERRIHFSLDSLLYLMVVCIYKLYVQRRGRNGKHESSEFSSR